MFEYRKEQPDYKLAALHIAAEVVGPYYMDDRRPIEVVARAITQLAGELEQWLTNQGSANG